MTCISFPEGDTPSLLTDLFRAYFDARLHKRNTINQLRFEVDYEKNLLDLYGQLRSGTYNISPSVCFVIDKPVRREIFAADFRDRVVHHLIYNYLSPVFENIFIPESYSCRKGKGTLYGIRRVESFIRECSRDYTSDCYVLKLDIKGYFVSIDKALLLEILSAMIKGAVTDNGGLNPFGADTGLLLYLVEKTLADDPRVGCRIRGHSGDWDGLPHTKSLFHARENCGLPIGNLTSQLFSNVYLHSFDSYVRDTLGFCYYGRYVDDFVLVHPDKEILKAAAGRMKEFLRERLHMELHPRKVHLQHYSKGINFLGATIRPYRTYVSKRTQRNFTASVSYWNRRLGNRPEPSYAELVKMRACINSYLGLLRHHRTYNIRREVLLAGACSFLKYGYLTNNLERFVLKKGAGSPGR